MDTIRSGCVEMQWNPETRLCFVRYHDGPKATSEDGRKLVAAITGWVGTQPRPFAMLVAFAIFDLGPILRIASEMFALGAGLNLKTFATEALAREWLRKEGARA